MYCTIYGCGQPIVYLHGWGCDGSIFAPVVKLLPDCANYAVDFAGFGHSNPPSDDGWTVSDYAEQLYEFLTEHNLKSVTIVAHSFGCRVALVLAARYPNLICRMLLIAPAALRRFSFTRWCKVVKYKLAKRLGNVTTEKYGSYDYRNCSEGMRRTFVKVVNEDLSSYAKQVDCPVLIVNGRDDTATPLTHARRLNKLISHSQLVAIDGDHFAFFRTPSAFANTVKIFLE